jgi:hypothetical protein
MIDQSEVDQAYMPQDEGRSQQNTPDLPAISTDWR